DGSQPHQPLRLKRQRAVKIELGNFGFSRPEVVAPADKGQVIEAAGRAVNQVQRASEQAQENREAFQRATAATSFAKYQLALEDTGRAVQEDMATGKVSWETANEEFQSRAAKVEPPADKLDSPIDRENQARGIEIARERAR